MKETYHTLVVFLKEQINQLFISNDAFDIVVYLAIVDATVNENYT